MKKFLSAFFMRGIIGAACGPVVLAIVYGILGATGAAEYLAPGEVCIGILSVTVMAYIAAGITGIYTLEQLPLSIAILLHGAILYLDYLIMYLANRWIPGNATAIGVFTGIFVIGFALVWLVIYCSIRSKTQKLNQKLSREQA